MDKCFSFFFFLLLKVDFRPPSVTLQPPPVPLQPPLVALQVPLYWVPKY